MRFMLIMFLTGLFSLGVYAERVCGLERLAQLERLPELLEGTQALQVSSHGRCGTNMGDGYYATHPCLYIDENGEKVLFDEQSPGCLYRFWMTFTDTSVLTNKLRFYFDNETDPRLEISVGDFFGGSHEPFLFPLVGDADKSCRGYYSYYPFRYEQSLKITIDSVPTGTGTQASPFYYNITYHRFDSSDGVSSWDGIEDCSAVMEQFEHIGEDPKDSSGNIVFSGSEIVGVGEECSLFALEDGAVIQSIKLSPTALSCEVLKNTFLKMNWDGGAEEVNVPLGAFFGSSTNELEVQSVPIGMTENNGYYCYFPMPFWESATISISNAGNASITVPYEIQCTTNTYDHDGCGYFCAEHRRQYVVSDGNDVIYTEATGRGHFVGLSLFIRGDDFTGNNLDHLEGDERIYIDGSLSPAIYGTGTEDYFNCAWYFANAPALLPYHGVALQEFASEPPNATQAYRFHIGDLLPFFSSFRFGMEHGRANNTQGLYDSVAYYYMQPTGGLDQVASFDVTDSDAYAYTASGNLTLLTNTWSYEGYDDQTYITSTGLSYTNSSEFLVPIGTNAGIILRRTLDHGIGRQKAQVYVDDALVGNWYDADCNFVTQRLWNTTTYRPVEQRWLQSDFYLPKEFCAGKTNLHIRIVRKSDGAESWNEYHYDVFQVLPLNNPSDVDMDGLPDRWEVAYFNHIGLVVPDEDNDADGFSNYEEFIAHSIPNDSASSFKFHIVPQHGCSFYAYSDRYYDVYATTNLLGNWVLEDSYSGDNTNHYLSGRDKNVFYKLRARKRD